MRRSLSLLHVARRFGMRTQPPGERAGQASARAGLFLIAAFLLGSMLFSACSGPFGGNASSTPTASTRALNHIDWCAKPLMVFRDEGAATPTATPSATSTPAGTATATTTATTSGTPAAGAGTPTTVTDWSVVKANLGFTVYLPTTLPNGSCLVSAQATIHDPIFGGSFTIGYLLPDHSSLSLSEAPLKSQSVTFQCNPTSIAATPTASSGKATGTPTPSPTSTASQLCSGAKDSTNIVLSGPGSTSALQQIFNSLQPGVNWIPVS